MFLWWLSTKIVQAVMIGKKNMAARGGAYFPYISIYKTFKIILSETIGQIFNITRQECFFGDPLPELFKPSWFVQIQNRQWGWGQGRGRGLFSLYIYIEKFINLLVSNY